MRYIDGFLLTVPKKKLPAYLALAKKAAKVWKELGALEYRECFGEDMKTSCGVPFPVRAKAKKGEVVVMAWIVYKSRKHRDQVNAKVMQDPRLAEMCQMPMPFDMKSMTHGGFEIAVDA